MSQREREHAARIRDQFTRQAEPFAALSIHTQAQSLELLRDGLRLTGGERVLDAGCGPGLLAHYLARHAGEVVGLDATPAMLAKARSVPVAEGEARREFVEGDMEHLPFATGSFDAVVSRYTFHHLLHPEVAFDELLRVCKPGGRVVVCDATPRPAARLAYDAWERLRDPSHSAALTEAELAGLFDDRLSERSFQRFRLDSSVRDLLTSSFPSDPEALFASMVADVGSDALDMAARMEGDILMMSFPISVAAGTKRP